MDKIFQKEQVEEKFGRWVSPITPLMTARTDKSNRNSDVLIKDGSVYWTEPRPHEKGRTALMRCNSKGKIEEIVSPNFDIRTKVHEYGGAPFTLYQNILYFIHNKDQRLYVQYPNNTPQPLSDGKIRYADLQGCAQGVIAVAEEQHEKQISNFLVLIESQTGKQIILDSGKDFYSSPTLSSDEKKIAWLTWEHPNMPWDGTSLWVADVGIGKLENKSCLAGGISESIFQPQWSPKGTLFFVSDIKGWWNIYRLTEQGTENVYPLNAEFGLPQWRFGMSTWGFTGNNEQIICAYQQNGFGKLALLNPENKSLTPISLPFTDYSQLKVEKGTAVMLMGSATSPRRLMKLNLQNFDVIPLDIENPVEIDEGYFSLPKHIEFSTLEKQTAFGYYYAPVNKDYIGINKELPPLLVFSHGGPTGIADHVFNLKIQYWTSRGFAVVDINYGGSSGYGRAYRERLRGQWGLVDVNDCEKGALYLAESRLVNRSKLFIRGHSAGGYTTLAALAFTSSFSGGASYYGIGDLMAMANETHKFEARYLDSLVGPLPGSEKQYYDRSPLKHADKFSCPVIFFQGAEDKIVPKNQAEMMYRALKEKGIKTKLVIYENEEHGFRQAAHLEDSMKQELEFYLSLLV